MHLMKLQENGDLRFYREGTFFCIKRAFPLIHLDIFYKMIYTIFEGGIQR